MEKKFRRKNDCKLFMTKEEGQYYIDTYGGKLGELSYYEDIPDDLPMKRVSVLLLLPSKYGEFPKTHLINLSTLKLSNFRIFLRKFE